MMQDLTRPHDQEISLLPAMRIADEGAVEFFTGTTG
jgi:hypothetical protein